MKNLFLKRRFFVVITIIIGLLLAGYGYFQLFLVGRILLFVFLGLVFIDILFLFRIRKPVYAVRFTPDKLSNGDENEIRIFVENSYPFTIEFNVIDEIPTQFQRRDLKFNLLVKSGENGIIHYNLRPVKRGEYHFGSVHVFANSVIRLVSRRMSFSYNKMVPVYPSYLQLHKYEIMAISQRLSEIGIKKVRRLGHNMEFEQIKEYVAGDDFRTINWKATARKAEFMVNTYQDERSQQVYCLIDKGRSMQMPFDDMTLLDYSINATLILSNIAIKKDDKAGVITFQHKIGNILPASKRNHQLSLIQEMLFNQKTAYKESDFSRLYAFVRTKVTHRSLLLLFTNFETLSGMERQLSYLRKLARSHVLVVIFFENTPLFELAGLPAKDLREVYHKAIAEKHILEKKMISKTLNNYGIYTILTSPGKLNVDTINKYLEFKARGII